MLINRILVATLLLVATPGLAQPHGSQGASCAATGTGPPVRINIQGFKDRRGLIRVELYPANDTDFLADDVDLLAAGKPFRRIEQAVPPSGPVSLCIRAASPAPFALVVLHDRNADRKFALTIDGVGFGGNPKLGRSRPRAADATILVPAGGTQTMIRLNYWRGLGMRPVNNSQ